MKLEIEIPQKFNSGDVVRYPNTRNNQHCYYHITKFDVEATIINGAASINFWSDGSRAAFYIAAMLAGSYYDIPELMPMRPGTCCVLQQDKFEATAEKVFDFTGEILEPDTIENIDARQAAWAASPISRAGEGER